MTEQNPTSNLQNDSISGNPIAQKSTEGSALVLVSQTGSLISQASLTLTASSQALPTPPAGAGRVLLQVHGGTVTDKIYVSADGTAATTADLRMKNIDDTTAVIGGLHELMLVGALENIRALGTANGSIMIVWWFK